MLLPSFAKPPCTSCGPVLPCQKEPCTSCKAVFASRKSPCTSCKPGLGSRKPLCKSCKSSLASRKTFCKSCKPSFGSRKSPCITFSAKVVSDFSRHTAVASERAVLAIGGAESAESARFLSADCADDADFLCRHFASSTRLLLTMSCRLKSLTTFAQLAASAVLCVFSLLAEASFIRASFTVRKQAGARCREVFSQNRGK
jgi:hypothetical protein